MNENLSLDLLTKKLDLINDKSLGKLFDLTDELLTGLNDKRIEVAPTQETSNTDKLLQQLKTLSL